MSKDEARNSNVSAAGDDRAEGKLSGVKNFDSHEKSNENMSDEDVASNEAIGGGYDMEDEDAQDDEVRNVIYSAGAFRQPGAFLIIHRVRLRINRVALFADVSTMV